MRLRWLVRLFVILLALFAGLTFYKLTVLWDGLGAERELVAATAPIELNGPVLFISDLHVTHPTPTYTPDLGGARTIVIVGDFFENPAVFHWQFGDNDRERVRAGVDTFLPADFEGTIYWVSARNHDPQLAPFEYTYDDGVTITHLGKVGTFEIDGVRIVATHGEWFYAGTFGGAVSWAFDRIGFELPLERLGRRKLDLPDDTWLFTAHSHVPAIDQGARLANDGSFKGVPFNGILRVETGTALRVEDGEVALVHLW